jgi:hypothetical protein
MREIKLEGECSNCGGTGVYVGETERGGASVVCANCGGTGKSVITYIPFTGRKTRDDVERVYLSSYGFCIAPKDIDFDGIGKVDLAKAGVSYDEFIGGEMPKHIKKMGCPMAVGQGACHGKKGFVEGCGEFGLSLGGLISKCNNQCNKLECWERFEGIE